MISPQQIVEEYKKCWQDKSRTYMIENYLKTFDATQHATVPFKLFPRQKELVQSFSKYNNNITTKPRQAGISTCISAVVACELALAETDKPETVLVIANRLPLSKLDLKKIKEFLKQLPRWFWGEEYYGTPEKEKKDIFIKNNDCYFELFNGSCAHGVSSSESGARGVSSVSFLIMDEAAFIENGMTVYSQASAATASVANAKTVLISTPNGKDELYFSFYDGAKKKTNDFHLTELKWYQDPRYNKNLTWSFLDKETGKSTTHNEPIINSKGDIEYREEYWEEMIQKGYKPSSPWYIKMCNKLNNDKQKIAQELDVSFLGSSGTVVDSEIIEFHEKRNLREPLYYDNFFTDAWIFKEPIQGHKYILMADPSRGDGEDSSAVHIMDVDGIDDDGLPIIEQVFEYSGKLQGDILAEVINQYGRYYGNAFAVVDCIGSSGDACVLKLQEMGYSNLYYDDPNLKAVTATNAEYKETDTTGMPGFHNGAVRMQMLMNLERALRFNEIRPRSKRFTQELSTWIWKNGKPDHQSGFHDDTITSMAMGLFVLQFSFKKLEAVREKTKAILSSMILVQNMMSNKATIDPNMKVNKIPLPFYTGNTLKDSMNVKAANGDINKMVNIMGMSFFGQFR